MSPPSEEFLDTKTNEIKKISIVPKPKQNPHPPIWQVVDGARSIEWVRKFTKFVDKTFIEGGKEAKEPVLLVSVAAVFKNPWHGQGFVEDLRPTILDLAPKKI